MSTKRVLADISMQGFRRPGLLPFILVIMLIISSVAVALGSMAGPNYRQPVSIMGGGGSAAASTGYINNGTLGQSSPIGISQVAGSQINNGGFWAAAPFDLNIVGPDVTIDSTDPSTTPTNVTPMSITFSLSDTTTTFECKWDSGEFTPCSSPIGQSGFSEGPHTFEVRALNALLVPGVPATYSWDIDITNPTLSPVTIATNNTSGIWAKAGDSITLSITASENITAPAVAIASQSAIVSGSNVSWSASYTVQAGDMPGAATLSVSSYSDLAGNAGLTVTATTDLSTVSIDTTAPDTSLDSSPLSLSTSTTASFTFSGSDVGSGVASFECQLDSGGYNTCTSPQAFNSLGQGSHTFEVKAIDFAGNTDPTPASYTWNIDTIGPNAPHVTGTTPTYDTRPTWSWTTGGNGGNGTFRYQLNGESGSWTETGSLSFTPASPLAVSSYTLYVQERDTAGNWSVSGFKLIQINTSAAAGWTLNNGTMETCVNSAGQFQLSLSDAESDDYPNLIKVVQGNYIGLFTYAGNEDFDLTLQGGYNADCTVRTINPTLTILDGDTDADTLGNGVTLDMAMLNPDSTGNITADGFTVINGANDYDDGGCIRVYTDAGQTTVTGNIIHNCAAINGGGIGAETVSGQTLITNNIVHHNSAILTGGGIYSLTNTGQSVILNNTVADNEASDATDGSGGGVAVSINSDTGNAEIINNIIRGNIVNVTPAACADISIQSDGDANAAHAVVTFHHNNANLTNGVCSTDGAFTPGAGNINLDPQFVNQAAGDYHILDSSLCKDSGDTTDPDLPLTDMDGQPRIQGAKVDIGADEVIVQLVSPASLSVFPVTSATGAISITAANSGPAGITYVFEEKKDAGSFVQIYSGPNRYVNLSGRTSGVYTYRVKTTLSGWADSSWRDGSNTSTVTLQLVSPASLTVLPLNSTNGAINITSSIASPAGITYVFEEKKDAGSFVQIYSGPNRYVNLSGRTSGVYTYRVKTTLTNWADSGWRDGATSTVTLALAAPASLTVSPLNSTNGVINITSSIASPTGITYVFEESKDGGAYTQVYSGPNRYVNLTGRTSGVYTYRVKTTLSGWADSSWRDGSNTSTVTLQLVSPASLSVFPVTSANGAISITAAYSGPAGITYVFEQQKDAGSFVQIYSGPNRYVNLSGRTNGVYTYRVKTTLTNWADSGWRDGANASTVTLPQ